MFNPYNGKTYTQEEICQAIKRYDTKIIAVKCDDQYKQAAISIAEGKIIGWFQGRSEGGPRALGNRSILADPRNPKMKDILNNRVKFREAFRPFAPSVLFEFQQEYFDLDIPSPYMLMVADIWPIKRAEIPSVTHIDGTGRIQTVLKELSPEYHQLIYAFYERTGVPIVLNTSFNVNKEPIVESPDDAINCFLNTDIDELYIEHYYIKRV